MSRPIADPSARVLDSGGAGYLDEVTIGVLREGADFSSPWWLSRRPEEDHPALLERCDNVAVVGHLDDDLTGRFRAGGSGRNEPYSAPEGTFSVTAPNDQPLGPRIEV